MIAVPVQTRSTWNPLRAIGNTRSTFSGSSPQEGRPRGVVCAVGRPAGRLLALPGRLDEPPLVGVWDLAVHRVELVVERVEDVHTVEEQVGADPGDGVGEDRDPGDTDRPGAARPEPRLLAAAVVGDGHPGECRDHDRVGCGPAGSRERDSHERVQVGNGGDERDVPDRGPKVSPEGSGDQCPEGEVDEGGGHGGMDIPGYVASRSTIVETRFR